MNDTVLSLSLLNERLTPTAVHRGSVAGTWERAEHVTDLADFSSVLREAVKQTGYAGAAVSVVLTHQRLAQQLVESPSAKGRNLKLFLQSRVKQLKPFASDAAWSYQPTLPTRNAQAMLVHLFPRELLDQRVRSCDQLELHCDRVIPASAILQRQLTTLPLEPNEVALLAAETGGATTVVIGRKDGQIYLGRTLSSTWNVHPDRVNVDLNRTVLYVKQQFGVLVGSVWLFGAGAPAQIVPMKSAFRLTQQTQIISSAAAQTQQSGDTVSIITVGTVLAVTPQISADGWITLDITPAITSFVDEVIAPSKNSSAPVLDIKQSSTIVRLRDGETIVMGGLIQNTSAKNIRKIPLLGDIPLLGKLFQGRAQAKQKKELVIFLTPTIVQ